MAADALTSTLTRVSSALADGHHAWALVGGLAVAARSEPRFTRDMDVAIAVESDREAERVVFELQGLGLLPMTSVEQEAAERLATARLRTASSPHVMVDLLFASSGIEAEIAGAASVLEVIPGLAIPVALRGHLIALKLLSVSPRRLQDALDLRVLLSHADPEDLRCADEAAALIAERGFHRERDLPQLLKRWRAGDEFIPS